jgi:hypothetical protein
VLLCIAARHAPACPNASLFPGLTIQASSSDPCHLQETQLQKNPVTDKKPFNARANVVPIETNWIGVLLFLSFSTSGIYYFYVRATRTMDIGWTW